MLRYFLQGEGYMVTSGPTTTKKETQHPIREPLSVSAETYSSFGYATMAS